MTEWIVQLVGDQFYLEELPRLFRSDKLRVTKKEGEYFLRSSDFESLHNANDLRAKATMLTQHLNGISKLFLSRFRPIGIGGVAEIDEKGKRHYLEVADATIRVKSSVVDTISDRSDEKLNEPTTSDLYIEIAERDSKVRKALRLLGSGENWASLFNIFEVLQSDVGGKMYKDGWITEANADLFRRTANSALAIGDDARHGHEKVPPPRNPMSLDEARILIRNLVKKWLDHKIRGAA